MRENVSHLFHLLPRRAASALFALSLLPWQSRAQIQKPPVPAVRPVSDTYYGQTIVDPYRWLEDQKSPEVKNWMRAQADYTLSVLDSMPGRAQFATEMKRYLYAPVADTSDVQVAGSYIFYRKRLCGEDQESLYVRDRATGSERMLLNVQKLSSLDHHISLDEYNPSDDGKYVVVAMSPGGSEIQTAHILESATGRDLPEQIDRFEGGGFSPGSRTLYYLQLEKLAPDSPWSAQKPSPMAPPTFLSSAP